MKAFNKAAFGDIKKEKSRDLRDWWLVELSLNFTWWWTTLTFLDPYRLQSGKLSICSVCTAPSGEDSHDLAALHVVIGKCSRDINRYTSRSGGLAPRGLQEQAEP